MEFNEDIFIIDCWIDNESKKNDLLSLLERLKEFNIPILLTGHYPVSPEIQKKVDYFIYDKKNEILTREEFKEYDVYSDRWTKTENWEVINSVKFQHDYAIWETWRNSFNFVKSLGKKYIHFLEYDNLIDVFQYRQGFLEEIRRHDSVIYEYHPNSSNEMDEYCASFIFSIKTDIAVDMVSKINSKKEYFYNRSNGWQLERIFLKYLKSTTDDVYVTKYIANDNELNTQAVWNRDNILRNGAAFQVYSAVDEGQNLYLHFIHGFYDYKPDEDYLIEIVYNNFKTFHKITKDNVYSLLNIGKYYVGSKILVFYQGIKVYDETLDETYEQFRSFNKVNFNTPCRPDKINIHFIDGPFIEILDKKINDYTVDFIDNSTNELVFSTKISSNCWAKASRKFNTDWKIVVKGNKFYYEYIMNLSNQRVLISFDSGSLGDSIAWIPYVEEFRKKYNCTVFCSTFKNDLFRDKYPNIIFINPGDIVQDVYAQYRLGYYYSNEERKEYNHDYHPIDPKTIPLQKVASDILNLEYEEINPNFSKKDKVKKNQVAIAIHSTAQCKYWNNPNGWQDVTDFLIKNGYEVILVSKEDYGYMGNKHPMGIKQLKDGPFEDVLRTLEESKLFIGISSGLSWVSWSYGVPTILISGFTDEYLEPKNGIERIINKKVCHGCWSKHNFNPSDWNWCPLHKDDKRMFECSKKITSKDVIDKIKELLNL